MLNKKPYNKLLEYFGLNSYGEMVDYIRKNPEDAKVKEIKELFKPLHINFDGEVDRNEE